MKKWHTFLVRVLEEDYKELKKASYQEDISIAEKIRQLIKEHFASRGESDI